MDVKATVVKIALKKMFKDGHFDICTIDKCLRISGGIKNLETYNIMSALHCIDYGDMEEDMRQWLVAASIDMVTSRGFDLSVFDVLTNESIINIDDYQSKLA